MRTIAQEEVTMARNERTDKTPADVKQIVYCKDCAFVDTLECPMNYIDHQRLIFTNRAPDWFCAEGVLKDEQ